MNDKDHYLEENISELIRAGFGTEARPGPSAGKRALRLLRAEMRASRAVAFPQGILGLLTGVLALMAVWLATQLGGPAAAVTTTVLRLAVALVLFMNLASVPVAGIVIVRRRR